VYKEPSITLFSVEETSKLLGINKDGLTNEDRRLLQCLYDNMQESVGVDTLSILLSVDQTTISNEIEPYLVQQGLIIRTPRGRSLTDKGVTYVENNYIQDT
jgi:Holliday junction DNA helicase RuvB